jgi:hypothetical protein
MGIDLDAVGIDQLEVSAEQIGPVGVWREFRGHVPRLPPALLRETPGIVESAGRTNG